jgi:hypothetical protein
MVAFEPALIVINFETNPDLFPIKILTNIKVEEELSTPFEKLANDLYIQRYGWCMYQM